MLITGMTIPSALFVTCYTIREYEVRISIIGVLLSLTCQSAVASDWEIEATSREPYAGPIIANGLIGITPWKVPMRTKLTILNGVMDDWGEDGVQSLSPAPNFMDIDVSFNGRSLGNGGNLSEWRQTLNLKKATLTTEYFLDKCARVSHSIVALRHLPHNALATVKVSAQCEGVVAVSNKIVSPDVLTKPESAMQNYKWPHTKLDVLTHSARTPAGAHEYSAATIFTGVDEGMGY